MPIRAFLLLIRALLQAEKKSYFHSFVPLKWVMSPMIFPCPSSGLSNKKDSGQGKKIIPWCFEESWFHYPSISGPWLTMEHPPPSPPTPVQTPTMLMPLPVMKRVIPSVILHPKNHCIKALVVLCRGLMDGEEPLLDIEEVGR